MDQPKTKKERALLIAKRAGGPVSLAEFRQAGIPQSTVRSLVLDGLLESPARGVFVPPGAKLSEYADWALVAFRHPSSVVCLLSAASFHGMTQELPGKLSVAVPNSSTMPSMGDQFSLPLDVLVWRRQEMFEVGVEVKRIDGVDVQVTSPERTLVDLFRYSSLNSSMRSSAVRITDEMFLESLERCHGGTLDHFSFESVSSIARVLGCYQTIRPYTKTMRFRRGDQLTL